MGCQDKQEEEEEEEMALSMRRIVLLVTVALVMAAMLVASAIPALAKANRDNFKESHPEGTTTANFVYNPSDRVNVQTRFRPAERQGGGGG